MPGCQILVLTTQVFLHPRTFLNFYLEQFISSGESVRSLCYLLLQVLIQQAQLFSHLVERSRQHTNFIFRQLRCRFGQVPSCNLSGCISYRQDGSCNLPRQPIDAHCEYTCRYKSYQDYCPRKIPRRGKSLRLAHLSQQGDLPIIHPAIDTDHWDTRIIQIKSITIFALQRCIDPLRVYT